MSRRRALLVPLSLAGGLLLGACGEDDAADGSAPTGASVEDFCQQVQEVVEESPDEAAELLGWRGLASSAPPEIRADLATFLEVWKPGPDSVPRDELEAAVERLTAYIDENCGLTLD